MLTILASNAKAILFTSLNPIKIEESKEIHLSLIDIDSLDKKILFQSLPHTNIDTMQIDENGKILTTVYMYMRTYSLD